MKHKLRCDKCGKFVNKLMVFETCRYKNICIFCLRKQLYFVESGELFLRIATTWWTNWFVKTDKQREALEKKGLYNIKN